jgi:hypothetical protein
VVNKTEMMIEYNQNAFSNFDTQAMVPCPNCQRTFLADRLEIHSRSCKAGKPLKMRAGLLPKIEKDLTPQERRILGKVPLKTMSKLQANADLDY